MGDERSFEKRFTADKLFDEVEEEKLSAFFLGDKARTKFSVSKEWAKKGQIEAGYEAYKESHRIHEKIHDDLYSMVVPNWGGHSVRHSYRFTEARKIANAGVSISEKAEMWYLYEKNIIYMGNSLRDEGLWNIYINKSESEEKKEHQKIAFSFFQSAIDTMQKAIEVANTLGIISDIAMLHGKIGNIYCHMGHGNADLFRLAEENLEKALDVCPTVHGKYHTNLDLGRLYVFWAGKLFKDGKNEAKEVENKVKEAEKRFSLVYKDTENKAYRAKAAFGLGVVAFETVLIEKLKGDDRKKKFDEAWDKFREACELFEKCESKVMEDKFLSGQEAEDFTNKYNEQPIDLRSRAEMQYGQAAALVGLSIYADEYTDEEDLKLARMWLTDKRDLIYDQAFKQVSKSVDFLRDAYRDLNMLRVSLDKEENEAQKVMDDSRKVVISTWLKENKGIEEKHDETAELKWGFPISKEAIE
ncbi:MAG: hypothetical protein GY795_25705 [Desulfobacterales bacterium]|nr:hypothetical protein [Desulfobacterales bacterium]